MAVPLHQMVRVGAYVVKQRLKGVERYPLVLMLEPLFRCNLACAGCGKIDYPDAILNQRLSVAECLEAVDECGAPVVSIAGGEPLLHREIGEIVAGIIARKKFVYLCTNALLLEKKLDLFTPNPVLRLVGPSRRRPGDARPLGVPGRRLRSRGGGDRARQGARLPRQHQLHPLRRRRARARRRLLRPVMAMGVDGITVSPGYAYERAPDQEHFLNRHKTKELFRDIFRRGTARKWSFSQSGLFLDFLAGNQNYHCTPWGNPTRTYFGWQRPCYLLGEGYAKTFKELMDDHRLGRLRHRQL